MPACTGHESRPTPHTCSDNLDTTQVAVTPEHGLTAEDASLAPKCCACKYKGLAGVHVLPSFALSQMGTAVQPWKGHVSCMPLHLDREKDVQPARTPRIWGWAEEAAGHGW